MPGRTFALGEGLRLAEDLARRLTFAGPRGGRRRYPVLLVGGARRGRPRLKDLDLLVVVPDGAAREGLLASGALEGRGRARLAGGGRRPSGPRRRALLAEAGGRRYPVDLFLATRAERPFALFHFASGRPYNVRVRAHAKRRGLTLNQYGVFRGGRRARGSGKIRTERGLARFLGVTYRPPEAREA